MAEKIYTAREVLTYLYAESKWTEDVDGDCEDGVQRVYVNHDVRIRDGLLEELLDMAGIEKKHTYETPHERLARANEEECAMTRSFGVDSSAVYAPDTIIRYADGSFGPMMFHYAHEGCLLRYIAKEHGFDLNFIHMEDVLGDDDPLFIAYFENGESDACSRWTPPECNGWRLVGKSDGEDGPFAIYIRPISNNGSGAADAK